MIAFVSLGPVEGPEDQVLLSYGERYFRVSRPVWLVLERLQLGEFRDHISADTFLGLSQRDVVEALTAADVLFTTVRETSGPTRALAARLEFDASFLVMPLAAFVRRISLPRRFCVIFAVLCTLVHLYAGLGIGRTSFAAAAVSLEPLSFGLGVLLLFTIFILHELAHAVTAVVLGCRSHKLGLGINMIFPAFYADVSEIWRLSKWKRVAVNAAGIVVQSIAGLFILAISAVVNDEHQAMLRFVTGVNVAVLILNLLPFLRLDGYWILSDILDVPDLRNQAKLMVKNPRLAVRELRSRSNLQKKLVVAYAFCGLTLLVLMTAKLVDMLISLTLWIARNPDEADAMFVKVTYSPAFWLISVILLVRGFKFFAQRSGLSRRANG